MSKLSRLLHKEIKPSDTPINGCLDWWVSYLDERPPRGTLALPHHCVRDREGCNSAGCQGHLAATAMTRRIGPRSFGMIKIRKTFPLLLLLQMFIFNLCGPLQGYTATHDDCGSLKETHEGSCNRPLGFLKNHSRPSGTDCSLWSPPAAASCLSFLGRKQICEDFDIEYSPKMFGWHTDNTGHLLNHNWKVIWNYSPCEGCLWYIMYWQAYHTCMHRGIKIKIRQRRTSELKIFMHLFLTENVFIMDYF